MNQKGAIAPLMLLILIIGMAFGVYLVQQKTNLFSKAAAPAVPAPEISENFDNDYNPLWVTSAQKDNTCQGSARITQSGYLLNVSNGECTVESTIQTGNTSGFSNLSMVVDFRLSGNTRFKTIGVVFGAATNACNERFPDCYKLLLRPDGYTNVLYQHDFRLEALRGAYTEPIIDNIPYRLRVDRNDLTVKAWISRDIGRTWQLILDTSLDIVGKGRVGIGPFVGLTVSSQAAGGVAEGFFDSFKVWRYGQLPEPGSTITPVLTPVVSPSATLSPTAIPNGVPQIFSSSIKVSMGDVVEIPGRNLGISGTVYYSRGGSHEVTARVSSWSEDMVKVYKRISEPTTINGPDAVDIIGDRYIRVCRYPNYACTEYTLMPAFP